MTALYLPLWMVKGLAKCPSFICYHTKTTDGVCNYCGHHLSRKAMKARRRRR